MKMNYMDMNKVSKTKKNRGDEKHKILNKTKSKLNDIKRQDYAVCAEQVKKSTHKPLHINDESVPGKSKENKKNEGNLKPSHFKDKLKMEINELNKQKNYGDGGGIKESGKIYKYIFQEEDEATLKLLHYSLDFRDGLLTLTDPKKPANKKSYFILNCKEICYDHIKDRDAFQLKVKIINKDMISDLILKPRSNAEKYNWLEEFGIKMSLSCDLLHSCIEEVENRRFRKGQKKRNELTELKEVDIGTLLRALERQSLHKLNLSNDKRWNVSRIEKLIQVLLNETPQPLIPYQLQDTLEKSTHKTLPKDYAKILKYLPVESHKMLQMLIEHLENLTSYYSTQLNASLIETDKIRRSICSRLTPLIIRHDFNNENETMNPLEPVIDEITKTGKFCLMIYKLMESSDLNRIKH